MFAVIHQLIDKVHGWRSEEDRVNAHNAVTEYEQSQSGVDAVDPTMPVDGPSNARQDVTGTKANIGDRSAESVRVTDSKSTSVEREQPVRDSDSKPTP